MNDVVGQLLRLPFTLAVSWMELLAQTLRGALGGAGPGAGGCSGCGGARASPPAVDIENPSARRASATIDWQGTGQDKERPVMADRDLENDDVKLVQYTIVSVARGSEHKLPDGAGEKIVTENMSGEAFATWVIAEYVQEYPHRVPHREKRFLRVYYSVLDQWPRESLHYEEKQLERLAGIEEAIRQCCRYIGEKIGEPPPAGAAAAAP